VHSCCFIYTTLYGANVFGFPLFTNLGVLTLTGKIMASGPRWKGHLPDDSFIIMMTEIGGASMLCARRRKALVRAVRSVLRSELL